MPAVRKRKGKVDAASVQNRYDAAGMGRRIKGWTPPSSGPQRAVEGLQRIRDRARDSTRNDWAGESGVQKWTTNLIGVGIVPRWEDDILAKVWADFVPHADADDVLDAYGQQTLMTRSWLASGEIFLRRRARSLLTPLEIPLQVQLIESDFVPLFDADTWPGMPAGNTIRQGIERNLYGRRTAYWMYKDHPGDKPSSSRPSADQLIRVLASDVSHIFEPVRPGQLRGVSSLAPILARLRASMDFEDAVLDRQKLANLFTMFITRAMPQSWADIDTDPLTGLPKWYDDAGRVLAGLEPGISQDLAPGEDVKFANPPEAGTTYSEYMRTTHMGTAAGQGLPYELLSGDLLNVSDRTLRIAINEFRRFAQQRQWQIIIPLGCAPIVRWVGEAALLKGRLTARQYEQFVAPTWAPQGWEYIHPVQDVEGKLKARDGGLVSTSQLISERGDDPKKVLKEIQADKASGLTPEPVKPAAAAAPAPAPAPTANASHDAWMTAQAELARVQATALRTPQAAPAPTPVAGMTPEMLTAVSAAIVSAMAPLLQALQAQASRPHEIHVPPAAVHNEIHPSPVAVHNEVHPSPLTVNNEVHVPEGPTPVVNVTNEVQPAAVTVDVNLPPREIVSDITRDLSGDISKVVQTERTIN